MSDDLAGILKTEFASGHALAFHIATQAELEDFVSVPADCHRNASRWVAEHPTYSVVEGWLAEDPTFLFVRHSVVADESGQLVCVTLGPQGKTARGSGFLVHCPEWSTTCFADLPPDVQVPLSLSEAEMLGDWRDERDEPDADLG